MEVGRSFDVALPTCAEELIAEKPRTKRRSAWWLAGGRPARAGLDAREGAGAPRGDLEGHLRGDAAARTTTRTTRRTTSPSARRAPVSTGLSDLREDYSDPLWLLLGISALVLLIACANIANLMVARASARQREIAVRLALGASRRRLIRQLLAESFVLAAAGAACGVALAQALSRLLVSFLSTEQAQLFVAMPRDLRLLGFTAGLAVLTCVLFGLLPALQASKTDPLEAIKSGGRGIAGERRHGSPCGGRSSSRRWRSRSSSSSARCSSSGASATCVTLDAGFRSDHILVVGTDYMRLHLPAERRAAFRRELVERVRAIPGVDRRRRRSDRAARRTATWNDPISIEGTEIRRQSVELQPRRAGLLPDHGHGAARGTRFR